MMKKTFFSAILATIFFSGCASAGMITTSDPLVGTWIGFGETVNPNTGHSDSVAFTCTITGGYPSGTCYGHSRTEDAPWDVWMLKITGGVYRWCSNQACSGGVIGLAMLSPDRNTQRTTTFAGGPLDVGGQIEWSTMFRATGTFNKNTFDQFFYSQQPY